MIIVYFNSNLRCVGTVVEGMTVEQEIELNVIPNFGGTTNDYSTIETEETFFNLVLINGIVTVVPYVPIPVIPEPTEVELLKAELDSTREAVNFFLMNTF